MRILISSRNAAATTQSIPAYTQDEVNYNKTLAPVVWCWDLGAAEEIEIQFRTDKAAPNDWETMHSLTAARPRTAIFGKVDFRVVKPITADTVGVAMTTPHFG